MAEVFEKIGDRRVALVNLRAQFGQSKKRIDASGFRERLRQDWNEGVFSLVSIDGDDESVYRIVRSAIESGDLFGEAFVSRPDFEVGNFEPRELGEVLWEWIKNEEGRLREEGDESDDTLPEQDKVRLLETVKNADGNKEFFRLARVALEERVAGFDKNEEWGRRLMSHATKNPEKHPGEKRLLVEAVERAYDLAEANYFATRTNYSVDTSTWRLIANG